MFTVHYLASQLAGQVNSSAPTVIYSSALLSCRMPQVESFMVEDIAT